MATALSIQLDRLFDLSAAGVRRRRAQVLLFSVLVFVIAYGLHTLLRLAIEPSAAPAPGLGTLISDSVLTAWRILLVVGIAVSLTVQFAGRFVADTFGLKDARLAWRFVSRLASGAGTGAEVLRLQGGRLSDKDRGSLIVQIGGPGRVVVDHETAALFEQADGRPHVVGASNVAANGNAGGQAGIDLDAFERLREPVISLRDQYIGEPSGEPLTVVGRSLDGMPISVTDVRGVFSVRRHEEATTGASVQRPFPFRARDIESLIYKQAVEVLVSGEHASGIPGDWAVAMRALICDALREFMGRHRLSEFISGVGDNEAERSEYQMDSILSRTLEVSAVAPHVPSAGTGSTARFRPRTELSARFRKYGSEFSTRAHELGMELHWIGVGTWMIPDQGSADVVSAKHIEAWRVGRENAERVKSETLERITEAALLEHKLGQIQEVPLARHEKNRARHTDKATLMRCLLQDFWEQLGDALDIHYRAGTPSTEMAELETAVSKVEQVLGISQTGDVSGDKTASRIRKREAWDKSGDGPPAPSSRAEAIKYQALLAKLKGEYRVAEAMIANEKRRHSELNREQLISRIVERFERHGR
jgi:hypothetical protein